MIWLRSPWRLATLLSLAKTLGCAARLKQITLPFFFFGFTLGRIIIVLFEARTFFRNRS